MNKYFMFVNFVVIVLLVMLGVAVTISAVHEYIHKNDLSKKADVNDICFIGYYFNSTRLGHPTGIYGYTNFAFHSDVNQTEQDNLVTHSEQKAYLMSFVTFALLCFPLYVLIKTLFVVVLMRKHGK